MRYALAISLLMPSACHKSATVDVQDDSGDVGGFIASQEEHRINALLNAWHTPKWDRVEHFATICFREGIEHSLKAIGEEEAGGDGINANIFAAYFLGKTAREAK